MISSRAVALQGIGFAAALLAVQGFGPADVPVPAQSSGGIVSAAPQQSDAGKGKGSFNPIWKAPKQGKNIDWDVAVPKNTDTLQSEQLLQAVVPTVDVADNQPFSMAKVVPAETTISNGQLADNPTSRTAVATAGKDDEEALMMILMELA